MTTAVTTTTHPTAEASLRSHGLPSLHHLLRRLTGRVPGASRETVPTGWPVPVPEDIAQVADSYTNGAPVWAYVAGQWLKATVAEIDAGSAVVIYQVPGTGETSLEIVHASHLAHRGATPETPTVKASPPRGVEVGQARATLFVHHADEHGMCNGCADLAHFCWAPCRAARDALQILDGERAHPAGPR